MMWFHVTAAGRLLTRRRGPVLRMVFVAWIGTLWCVAGGVWTLATYRAVQRQASTIQVDVILRPTTTEANARIMIRGIRTQYGVGSAELLREQDVWAEFAADVDIDDRLRSVVAMPRLIRWSPTAAGGTARNIRAVISRIEQTYADQIDDIVWSEELASVVDARRRDVLMLGSVAGGLSLLLFLIAVTYSFRAELHAAAADLRVGSVLGASSSWVAMPHVLVSMITGALGLLLALATIAGVAPTALSRLPWVAEVRIADVGLMVAGLAGVGVISSWWQSLAAGRRALIRR